MSTLKIITPEEAKQRANENMGYSPKREFIMRKIEDASGQGKPSVLLDDEHYVLTTDDYEWLTGLGYEVLYRPSQYRIYSALEVVWGY